MFTSSTGQGVQCKTTCKTDEPLFVGLSDSPLSFLYFSRTRALCHSCQQSTDTGWQFAEHVMFCVWYCCCMLPSQRHGGFRYNDLSSSDFSQGGAFIRHQQKGIQKVGLALNTSPCLSHWYCYEPLKKDASNSMLLYAYRDMGYQARFRKDADGIEDPKWVCLKIDTTSPKWLVAFWFPLKTARPLPKKKASPKRRPPASALPPKTQDSRWKSAAGDGDCASVPSSGRRSSCVALGDSTDVPPQQGDSSKHDLF